MAELRNDVRLSLEAGFTLDDAVFNVYLRGFGDGRKRPRQVK